MVTVEVVIEVAAGAEVETVSTPLLDGVETEDETGAADTIALVETGAAELHDDHPSDQDAEVWVAIADEVV